MTKSTKRGRKKKKLTPRHRKFIDFFIECDNATEAYIKAGYSVNGAGQAANNLLKKTYIIEALEKRRRNIAEKSDIKMQDVINEWAKIAFANSEDFFEWQEQIIDLGDGNFKRISRVLIKPPSEINRDKKAAIAGIKETTIGLEFKFHDKEKALDALGKYFGMSTDAEVEKSKRIKGAEKQPIVDPCANLDEEELDKQIKELEDN